MESALMIRLNKEWGGLLMLAMFSGALFVLALIYGLFLMIKDRNVTKKKLKRMTDNRLLTAVSNWMFHYYREGLEEPELLVQIPDVHRHVLTLPIVNEEIGCGGIPQLLANHGMDMLIYGKEAAEAWGLNFYAEALKEAIRRSAADPGNVAEGLYDDLESEIYTPEQQAEYQKTLLRVIHENIDSFGF